MPSSLGEATVILSLLLYLFGGREPAYFLPGLLAGTGELIFSRPSDEVRDNLAVLERTEE